MFFSYLRIQVMKDSMLAIQLLVPNLQTDAKVTANLNCVDGLTLELESDLKIPETSSVQKVILKYGTDVRCLYVIYCMYMVVFEHIVKILIILIQNFQMLRRLKLR